MNDNKSNITDNKSTDDTNTNTNTNTNTTDDNKSTTTSNRSITFMYIFLGFILVAVAAVIIYGFASGSIENGNNIYLSKDANFKPSTGSLIIGIISLTGSLTFLGVAIWYYYSHKREYIEKLDGLFKDDTETDYKGIGRELRIKNSNIFLIMLTFSFFLLFLGVSTFLNQKESFSIYQAYQRECPQNTLNAEDQKHPNDLL